jgi:hypothetical protein
MSNPPVVGFIGTGHIATFHSKMLRRSPVEIVRGPVFDLDPARAAAFAAASGSTVAASEDEVIAGSDLVWICTWTSEHARLVDKCIAAGRPFFCEKPLSVDLPGATAMARAAAESGLPHQCGLILRRSPAYLWARELITDPVAGAPMSVVFRDDQFIPVQGHYNSTWRADASKAGAGTLLEHSIHDVDMLRFLVGDIEAEGRTKFFGAVHACTRQYGVIAVTEPLWILVELGIETKTEEQTVGIGPVVKVAAVVVGFEYPHVRVASARIDSIAIRSQLCIQHHFVEFAYSERSSLATCEYFGFEEESTVDVDDYLRSADQIDIQQAQTLVTLETRQALFDDECLTENTGRLCEGHGESLLERCAVGKLHVVIRVAQFVGRSLSRFGTTTPVQ